MYNIVSSTEGMQETTFDLQTSSVEREKLTVECVSEGVLHM